MRQTVVHLAILQPKRLIQLLESGVDVDCVDNRGRTPLMYAAAYGSSESVILLVEYGAQLELEDQGNWCTSLDFAVRRHHLNVIVDLVDHLREQRAVEKARRILDGCLKSCLAIKHGRSFLADTTMMKPLLCLLYTSDAADERIV